MFVRAYNDPAIVAGQGTLGLELAEQVPDLDTVVVPIGGGGLIAGISTALALVAPSVRIVGEAHLVFEASAAGREHTTRLIDAIADRGYDVTRSN